MNAKKLMKIGLIAICSLLVLAIVGGVVLWRSGPAKEDSITIIRCQVRKPRQG